MSDTAETLKELSFLANRNQQKASNPEFSVWVEASAGTGKTKVLTDRVLRLLLSGVRPSKILCLTYTKAAASVMRERISEKLSRWAVVSDEELEKDLMDVCGTDFFDHKTQNERRSIARKLFATFLDSSEDIKIQTIHSFCQDILKRFPLEAKISPYFDVMDERKSSEILKKIQEDIITDSENRDVAEAVGYLVEKVSESSFPKILKNITEKRTKIAEFLHNYKSFAEMKNSLAASLGVDVNQSEKDLKEDFIKKIDRNFVSTVAEIFSHSKKITEIEKYEYFSGLLRREITVDDFDKYISQFLDGKGEIKTKKLYCADSLKRNPEIEILMQNEANRAHDLFEKLGKIKIYASTIAVLQIAGSLVEKYRDYKQKVSKMDYEDLIVLTKNLLADKAVADWVMYKLDEGIDHILVDEAQDNSVYQWDIVKSLSEEFFAGEDANNRKRTVFAVGDRKQSIYSFQGANPEKFENMRNYFSLKSDKFKTVNLDMSFRSAPAVLSVVNTVFKMEKAKKGVIPDGQEINHLAFHCNWQGKVEIWNIKETDVEKNEPQPDDYDYSKITPEGVFAKRLVQKIKNIVDNKDYLDSKKRAAKYKDFMILVRNREGRFLPEFLHECQNAGVPTEGSDQIKLLEQIAVQDLISLGKFLLLPTDDLSLAEILKSPLFGLDDDDLIKLCAKRKSASLWSRLADFKEYLETYAQLQELSNLVDFVRPFELYSHILSRMGGRKKFISRMGPEVEDCLDEFMNLTLSYEEDRVPSLQGFISWILSDDVKIKRSLEQSENDAVKIMTVHGSKGLQAPIVILPDAASVTTKKHSLDILQDDFIYVPLSSKDYEARCEKIYQQEQAKELDEYRRLLYVAITRAEDRLCICGYRKQKKTFEDSWYSLCHEAIKSIGKENDDGFVYTEGKSQDQELAEEKEAVLKTNLPKFDWLYKDAEAEGNLSKPYRPSIDSAQDEEIALSPIENRDDYRYKRGTLIHKILQFIGEIALQNRKDKIQEFLHKNATDLSEKQRQSIVNEVLKLLSDEKFARLFGKNSKAEVAIMGEVNGKIISAQIDRLVVDENKVIIVDYKTNRPAADNLENVPEAYLKQLKSYADLIKEIYPDKEIEAYILWTNIAKLMKIM